MEIDLKKRDPYFDVVKFAAILLVVYGHVAGAFHCEFGQPVISNFTVGMNMPLFFVISGYFAARVIEYGDWWKFSRTIFGYFWPLAVASCLFGLFSVVFQVGNYEKGLIGCAGRNFLFAGWFLYCLAICFSLTFLCMRPKLSALRLGAFVLIITILPCLHGIWHISNVRAMLPFFLLGVFGLRRWEAWRNSRIGAFCFVLYLVGVILQGDIGTNGLSFYQGQTTWNAFVGDPKNIELYCARLLNGAVGSVGVMWILHIMMKMWSCVARLASFGMTTLWVYILHRWFLDRVCDWGWYMNGVWCSFAWTVALFAICHVLGLCGQRIPKVADRFRTWVLDR